MVHFYTFKKRHQVEGLVKSYDDKGFEVMFYPQMQQCGTWRESVGLRSDEILMIRPLAEVSFLLFRESELSEVFQPENEIFKYDNRRI
ncbi:MAG: hypothetical protein NTV25_05595 [Methanothrix sp.]|jgi:hypothetical protein|nr:hypothetical protein [Methanothrix sp.]